MIILKILLLIILYLVLFVVSIFLILIISPIKGYIRFDTSTLYFKGSYLFGRVKIIYNNGFTVTVFGFKLKDDGSDKTSDVKPKKEKKKKEKKKKEKKKLKIPSKEVIVLTVELIKKLIKKIAPKRAKLHLTLGLDDPYITESIHIISMIGFIPLNNIKHYDFKFTPVNDDLVIDFEGEALVNFSVISLILPCLRYILRKPIRQYFNMTLRRRPRI